MNKRIILDNSMQPLFAGMSNTQIDSVMKLFKGFVRHYPKAGYLYLTGDYVENMYVLLSGSLHMIKEDFWGDKLLIEGLEPGFVFTDAYLGRDKAESKVSYLVASDSEILVLPLAKDKIKAELKGSPLGSMIYNLLCIMARQSNSLVEKNELLCKKSLREKISAYLLRRAKETHSKTFTIPFNRTDFASFIDSDRSALTRELSRMKEQGLIDYNKNTFTIKNLQE